MVVSDVPGVSDGTAITASRPTFDVGMPTFEGRLHVATHGDTVFEAILQQIEAFPLPDRIDRLGIEVADVLAKIVGYAVAEPDIVSHWKVEIEAARGGIMPMAGDA